MLQEDVYEMYLEELEAIPVCTPEENQELLAALTSGNTTVRKRLTEGNLKAALSFMKEYENSDVPVNDLVQEANVALLMAVNDYESGMGCFEDYLADCVRQALKAAVEAQTLEEKAEEEVLARVNVLKEVSQRMAEELGREATVTELAERMKMSEEEIKDIMKITLDALSVMGE